MKILKFLGFLLVALGLALGIPKNLKDYREEKNLENFLELFGRIIMVPSTIILAVGVYI
ncbi:hypothetical protein [Peptoniphilus hominis (ex Hitch et al. 2025)]|uniref:Uncharacterized protein n=1 Tax=Peptoniphilus hominis (ex Hitch et al. 2025) TaxID=3133174 RepID=A0ABV1CEY1_9FIRM